MMTHRILGLITAAVLLGTAELSAQDTKQRKPKPTTAFFDNQAPLDITVTVNIKQIRGDRGDSVPWRNATLATTAAGGVTNTIPMKMRTRGIWRRRKCDYPPIRLNFAAPAVKGTELEGLDKPKLVNFCRDAGLHEQYILQEFQLYRVNNLLTPNSHKARLLRLSYVDSASGKLEAKRFAFIIEEPKAMADRLGGQMVEQKGARGDDLDDYSIALFGLFEYMIGNTDFSISASHNAELLSLPTGSLIPVAYDFDFSGAVNTTYSTPEPKLRLENVRTRRYRAFCVDAAHMDAAVSEFNRKKEQIFALYDDQIGKLMQPRLRDSTLEYFREFYRIINDAGSLKSQIKESCLPRDQSDAPNR